MKRARTDEPQVKRVAFVKGTTLPGSDGKDEQPPQPAKSSKKAEDIDADDDADDDEDAEIDPRFRLDDTASELPRSQQGPQLPSRTLMSDARLEQSYGKGLEILRKIGWTGGGLGARNQGIANPIQVHQRKKGQALQEEGEMQAQDLYGREPTRPGGGKAGPKTIEEELTTKATQVKAQAELSSSGWKKDAKEKKEQKTVYKTSNEIAAEQAKEAPKMRIVDMRGPEVRVVNSFQELAAHEVADQINSLKELRHNARLLVTKHEDKLRGIMEKKRYYEDMLASVARDREALTTAASFTQEEVQRCRDVVSELEQLRERQAESSISLVDMGAEIDKLHRKYPKEFKALRAFEIISALVVPLAQNELRNWDPLSEPSIVHSVASWRTLNEDEGKKTVSKLCELAVLPRIQNALNKWSPRDMDRCKAMFRQCLQALPQDAMDVITKQILQRLESEVAEMKVRPDGQRLGPIKDLFQWVGLLPGARIAFALERSFFPHWQEALKQWLYQPSCNYNEVLKWYSGWRSLLPKEMLDEVTVRRQLTLGLQQMRSVMSQEGTWEQPSGDFDPYGDAHVPKPPKPPPTEEVALSLVDFLAETAGEQGVVFKPKVGNSAFGKVLYAFGTASVYVEQGAVYAQSKGEKDSWRAVGFEELLRMSRSVRP